MNWLLVLASLALQPAPNNLAFPLPTTSQIVIPVAGSAQGAFGTFFRSDVTVLNYGTRDQRLRFRWLPQGGGAVVTIDTVTLPARTGFNSNDFVTSVLGQSGLGTVIIEGVTAGGGVLDPSAELYVTSRIWTPQPGTSGTTSQSFLAVPLTYANLDRAALVGLRRDGQYRLNVGIVNLHPTEAQSFTITADGSDPAIPADVTPITIPAMAMQQINLPAPPQANLQVLIENVTPAATRSNQWLAYGSSTDNITGDSWSIIGFAPP